ncbi:hypothetical protein AB835_00005 [Candidatus Endobugula sertula]|uniref:Uncharacterized protein n=1 Tax=Candidatus Endobugula sertula TaxID=62101 RepID=A0A1D2QU77_9GAMM|nr:hypothetical protein AB835_00005 [Candidatus Endobugula sertula]
MKHYWAILTLAGVVFVGPNSEALLSNVSSFDMGYAGYHCTLQQKQREVNIIHHPHPLYVTVCDVTYQKNQQAPQTLWSDQRNASTCEKKAEAIAIRLKDRGWQCKTAGL